MRKPKISIAEIIHWLIIISADIFIYIFLGILQMDYDDNWDATKGNYGSLESMNKWQLIFYFALQLWNLTNIIILLLILLKMYKKRLHKTSF
jgi:hypothetical protein